MPISRDARMDRRRRILRDTAEEETQPVAVARRSSRKAVEADSSDGSGLTSGGLTGAGGKRKAGYSQDVRKACGQRLVQLIPVRRRSFAAACAVSLFIPGLLLALHYLIHVTGQLPWWRHPLAVALDVGHPRSIAAWLSSQLWLLCLGATVLTFQLRRHKLDDYNGEYRLWFWLVLTCLVASVDATTSIAELFAQALDRWTQSNMGWSGPAVVDSTLAVLIGMLGLRMCTELKVVPLSLVLWLVGLVAWASSAALARPELQLEMSAPVRYWLISALWMGGLTFVWLSALTFLRHIYMEAQQRFLLRSHLATTGIPLKQRLRESLPAMPRLRRGHREETEAGADSAVGSRWRIPRLPSFPRRGGSELAAGGVSGVANSQPLGKTASRRAAQAAATVGASDSASHGDPAPAAAASATRAATAAETAPATSTRRSKSSQPATESGNESKDKQRRGLGGWLRRPKDNDEAEEYRKVTDSGEAADELSNASSAGSSSERRAQRAESKAARRKQAAQAKEERLAERVLAKEERRAAKRPAGGGDSGEAADEGAPRRWMPKLPQPKLPKLARPKLPKISKPKLGGWTSRLKLPSIGLSALRLQPPEEAAEGQSAAASTQKMRPVNAARPLPGTNQSATNLTGTKSNQSDNYDDDDDDDQDGRPLSKAERKRQRREQQQGRNAA